jgi:hypothetical protein
MRARQATPAEMKSIGIGLGPAGLCGVLIGFGVMPVPGGRSNLHAPLWIAALIGLVALLAGLACLIQGFGRTNANAELPADAPPWMRAAQYLIGVALFAAFAVIGAWVAFDGDARHFSGGIPFLGSYNVSLARLLFGFGALICALAAVVYEVKGRRKLFGQKT